MKRTPPATLKNLVFSGVGGGLTALLVVLPIKLGGLTGLSAPLDRNLLLVGFLLPFGACLAGTVLLERKSEMPFGDCILAGLIGIVTATALGITLLLETDDSWGLLMISVPYSVIVLPAGVWAGRFLLGLIWRVRRGAS